MEVEIKVSVSDLKRDRKKRKWFAWVNRNRIVTRLFFAAPESMRSDLEQHAPEFAGLISVRRYGDDTDRLIARVFRKARRFPAKQFSKDEMLHLAQLGTMRYWTQKHKTAQVVATADEQRDLQSAVRAAMRQ